FSESGKSVQAELGTTLVEAAASAGLTIPKACGMGICGTCKVRVGKGEAAMEHNGGISEEEVAEGYVLSCCTRVTGAVEIEY
ncbi:2Fe-2S iron-sulfur cluster binding domain-containing protein, partial [Pseudomonas sp. CrR25]|nr:2Fe-2S iron-sulfur cluster binding domain-containing protein [Pseudomonas sp. CrR25]